MSKIAAFALLATATGLEYTERALQDEIVNLPNLNYTLPFRQFSGYVDLSTGNGKLFYWYVESQNNPDTDPLLWWTNGGPGCSGLAGLLTENGPFRIDSTGNVVDNPSSWNKVANMVFIEQPVGVGFSQASGSPSYGDNMAAVDNHAFLLGFYEIFPALKPKPLYLTSESYGGHYLPTLAQEIVVQKDIPNFKGFAVGNPLTWMPYRDFGQYGTQWGNQLLPKPLWDKYMDENCRSEEDKDICINLTGQFDTLTQDMDPYALNFPLCLSDKAAGRRERHSFMSAVRRAKRARTQQLSDYFPDPYEPCRDEYAADYLNRPEVQTAIHANPPTQWAECSNDINQNWNMTDLYAPMMPVYDFLATHADLNIMIYSGTDDSVCATLGSQQFIWDSFDATPGDDWRPWKTEQGQVAGMTQGFKQGVRFTTVNGAGHMVPATRPAQSLEMLQNYLAGKW